MRRHVRYFTYVSALAMGALMNTLFVSDLPVASSGPAPNRIAQVIENASKTNMTQPQFQVLDPNALEGVREVISPRAPVVDTKLPEGCESPVSFMARTPLVHTAARCST